MSILHVLLPTGPSKYQVMRDFYVATLQPLGYTVYTEFESEPDLSNEASAGAATKVRYCGLQSKNPADFWLHAGLVDPPALQMAAGDRSMLGIGVHVAFLADSTEMVDEWYKVALENGGTPNGEPGERPMYGKGYYAAFVLDPLGNNIEVAKRG